MSGRVLLDSNVLVALVDSRDKWHSRAKGLLDLLEARQVDLIYLDCVVNETISVLARRAEEQKRSGRFPALLDKLLQQVPEDTITWALLEIKRLYPQVIELVRNTSGALNFHDALMALFCREIGEAEIASFDEDFDRIAWLKRFTFPHVRESETA